MRPFSVFLLLSGLSAGALGCGGPDSETPPRAEDASPAAGGLDHLSESLLFHASFDQGPDADLSRGDGAIYSAPSYDDIDDSVVGLESSNVVLAVGAGRFGDALHFSEKNESAVFFRARGNTAYSTSSWSGTISFWLSVDPAVDLAPGYCDPIQLTDSAYNDAAIWVDFTPDNPRQFRLGLFGDLGAWNPDALAPDDNPFFMDRLVVVEEPPFASDRWTHVAITFAGLNTAEGGTARLYLDGQPQEEVMEALDEPFTWDDSRGEIRLGVNYVGLFDEIAIFDRPLTRNEIETLRSLDGGVVSLHP